MLTLRVHSVLPGAVQADQLTHASVGGWRTLCKRWRKFELYDQDEAEDPTCPRCLWHFEGMLRGKLAERALFNSGDCRPNMTESDLERKV